MAWEKLKRAFKDENQRALEDENKEVPLEETPSPWAKLKGLFQDENVKVIGDDRKNDPFQKEEENPNEKGFVAQFKKGLRR